MSSHSGNNSSTTQCPLFGTVKQLQQQIIPIPPPPPPPKMGLLKNSTSSPPKSKKKKGITFHEGGPVIIYREASDSETEEEELTFTELSLKSELSESGKPSQISTSSTADFDEENDPERVKLRQLTEANTFFNSNYANFKLNEAASVGLGRQAKGEAGASGPIKFVIQDGYQQPLPPTKYKAAAAAANLNLNLNKKSLSEDKNCDTKTSGAAVSKSPAVVKPTSAPPPLPAALVATSKPNKPVIEAKKPSAVLGPHQSSHSKSSSSSLAVSSKGSPSSDGIPTIRIPRAAINTDKLNRSPPPAFANSAASSPLKQALSEKTAISATKPEKPPKNISFSKPTEKTAKETSPPPPPPPAPTAAELPTIKPSDTTDSAPSNLPKLSDFSQQQPSYHSVTLLDENDGTILALDRHKLPEELKSDVADVRLDHGQLYLLKSGGKSDHQGEDQPPPPSQSPEKLPEKVSNSVDKKEAEADCCLLSDDCGCSSSDSGASGCSPSSASPTAQLLEEDELRSSSTSPSPTDSLDSAEASSPDSYESTSPSPQPPVSAHSVSPLPPPLPPSKPPPVQKLSSSSPPPAQPSAQSNSSASPEGSPRNSTMISISYRRSGSGGSGGSGSSEVAAPKRNEMLAKLAMDLEQHRAAGDAKKVAGGGNLSTNSSSASLQQITNNNNYILSNNNNRTQQQKTALPGFAADLAAEKPLRKTVAVPALTKQEQFLADCYGDDDDDDDELTNSKSRAFFARKSRADSTDDSSDSECDPLPDMIESEEEEEIGKAAADSDDNVFDSDDDNLSSGKHSKSAFSRRLSKDSGATKTSSSSSLGSKQSKENGGSKSVSALFRNVVQGSNTKKVTKLMRKNISKTSKFIVNTSRTIGSETSEMVKKLKDKSNSNEKADNYYYPEEYHNQTVKESKTKSKSKWTFSPNAQSNSEKADVEVTNFQMKKKANKFEPMYAFAKSAYRNIEEKMKTSGGGGGQAVNSYSKSSSSSAVGQAELPINPFDHNGSSSSSDFASSDAPALLKIKRLDSSYLAEPNYSEPSLLLNGTQSAKANVAKSVQSESALVKPPLPPRNYRVTAEEEEEVLNGKMKTEVAPPLPPQAPLRRKKLAKKRDQLLVNAEISPQATETEASKEAAQETASVLPSQINSLSQLKTAYESHYRVFPVSQSSIEIFTAVNLLAGDQSRMTSSSQTGSQLRFYRCAHRGEQFYLLSSKHLWTTIYDDHHHHSAMTFQEEPCRYLPIGFSRLYDIATFCRAVLYSSSSSSSAAAAGLNSESNNPASSCRAQLVDSLLLQLFSTLATFEEQQCTRTASEKTKFKLSIGDVSDCLVAFNEEAGDVILLLPTKELEAEADSGGGDDSLSMMQSFCLQVFLLRLTSMITNEDGQSSTAGEQKLSKNCCGIQHYRALVRRNQSGITELRALYLLAALDILKILPGVGSKRNSGMAKMTAESVEKTISGWFEEQQSSCEALLSRHYDQPDLPGSTFLPQSVATYALVQFAADGRNQVAAVELAKRELLLEQGAERT